MRLPPIFYKRGLQTCRFGKADRTHPRRSSRVFVLRLYEREPRFGIDGFMERLCGFGQYHFQRRAHMRLQQMSAMRSPILSPDDQMRMDDRLAVLERNIANER